MVMGACPGQIPISCVPLTLMVTATVVRACRYSMSWLVISFSLTEIWAEESLFAKRFMFFVSVSQVVRPGIRHSSLQSKWIVKPERYGAPKFPPYCVGPAYFLSFSLLPRIIANCPFHCIGLVKPLDSNSTSVNSSSCFWDWEDVFIGMSHTT